MSTVHQPAYELGRLAATAMLQLLAGTTPTVEVPAPRLIARESSRRLRG
jgi:LacI family transcriptional regulator